MSKRTAVENEMMMHLMAIWQLAKDKCPSGLLMLSVHDHPEANKTVYYIYNASVSSVKDALTPIDIMNIVKYPKPEPDTAAELEAFWHDK